MRTRELGRIPLGHSQYNTIPASSGRYSHNIGLGAKSGIEERLWTCWHDGRSTVSRHNDGWSAVARRMMGRYQQSAVPQGTSVTSVTHLTTRNFAYQPANIQVTVCTNVTWTNQDNVPHTVTFKNGMKDSGLLYQGQSFGYTFTTPGTYQYYCTAHQSSSSRAHPTWLRWRWQW
jgi:plastocyanin